jgi:DNA-directed RNA polymerase beta subunit
MTHRVLVTTDGTGKVVVRVQYVESHRPEVGDKFNARKGQKGVIGAIWSEADMYFNEHGRTPALVLNTCAFPSRMTWSMFLEQLLCEIGAVNGSRIDGTSFSKNWMQALVKQLDHKLLEPLSALDRTTAESRQSFVERYALACSRVHSVCFSVLQGASQHECRG